MYSKRFQRLFVNIAIISVLLAAFSLRIIYSGRPTPISPVQTASPGVPPLLNGQPWPVSKPSTQSQEDGTKSQVIDSYHALLMLERAADLIITVVVKIDQGDIPVDDLSARSPYTAAFAVAIDTYNKTTPPPGDLNIGWKMVSDVTQQFATVNNALMQGRVISNRDLYQLKAFRQIMTNFQNMEKQYLTLSGLGDDFFKSQDRAVDQHFKEAYGNQPLPPLSGSGG